MTVAYRRPARAPILEKNRPPRVERADPPFDYGVKGGRRPVHYPPGRGKSSRDQKITPCLWFDGQAEEAAAYYVSIFPNSRVTSVTPGPGGEALVVEFRLAGLRFLALNGGPHFKFNEAISLSIDCQSQAEVDELWEKLSAGGSPGQCGWLKDRYGVSWQVVPAVLPTAPVRPGDGRPGLPGAHGNDQAGHPGTGGPRRPTEGK